MPGTDTNGSSLAGGWAVTDLVDPRRRRDGRAARFPSDLKRVLFLFDNDLEVSHVIFFRCFGVSDSDSMKMCLMSR